MTEMMYIGAAAAVGLAGFGVAIGEGLVASKSLDCMGKNPELSGHFLVMTILGIALVESAAIYGLIIAFNILGLDPATIAAWKVIAAGFSVGLAGCGVGIAEGRVVSAAMDATLRNPAMKNKYLTFMILFIALVESAAIYGLIIAFQLLG